MKIRLTKSEPPEELRTFDAVLVAASDAGTDSFNQRVVRFHFRVKITNGSDRKVTKRYFGPFAANSALVRDATRIRAGIGLTTPLSDFIETDELVNARCRIKVKPGMRRDEEIIVLAALRRGN